VVVQAGYRAGAALSLFPDEKWAHNKWSLFRSPPIFGHGIVPDDDFLLDAASFEVDSGLSVFEAFRVCEAKHLSPELTAYRTHSVTYGEAFRIAEAYFVRNRSNNEGMFEGPPETYFANVRVTGYLFICQRPRLKAEFLDYARRGYPLGKDVIHVDAVDGHVWSEAEHELYAFVLPKLYGPSLPEWRRDQILSGFPEVLQTRLLALGEPALSHWLQRGPVDHGSNRLSSAARASQCLWEVSYPRGAVPGPERTSGVFRWERWLGLEPFRVDPELLRRFVEASASPVDAGVVDSVVEECFRESFVGAPTIKFEGPIYCGVNDAGMVCIVDDERKVVVDLVCEPRIEDRYSLFVLPEWLREMDLSLYRLVDPPDV
jgi:hypothetical protein